MAVDRGQRGHAEIDVALPDVVPGPRARDHHRDLAAVERAFHLGVTGALGEHAGADQVLQHRRGLHCPRGIDANGAGVEAAVGLLREDRAARAGQQRPGEEALVVVPEDGLLAVRGELLVDGHDLFPVGGRRLEQRLVPDQADRLDRQRVAPGAALVLERCPGRILDLVVQRLARLDRHDQARLGPLAGAVVRPAEDVRALAGAGGGLELRRRVVGVLHHHLHAGVGRVVVADLLQAVVPLVGIDPDEQLQRLGSLCKRRAQERGRDAARRDAAQGGASAHAASCCVSATWRRNAWPAASNR